MPSDKLRQIVSMLREELAAEQDLEPARHEKLRRLAADLEAVLAESEAPDSASLPARVADATSEFESSHPRLTELLGQVAEALSRMGI